MIRVLNFFCIAVTASVCLALNHVSDQTRVAAAQLHRTRAEIATVSDTLKILEADWQRASDPVRVQGLAAARLGLSDTATVSVASLELLPHRGEGGDIRTNDGPIAASSSTSNPFPRLHVAAANSGE